MPHGRLDQRASNGTPTGNADDGNHDHSFLPGMVSDAVHRLAIVLGIDIFHLELLFGIAARTVSQDLAASVALSSVSDGAGKIGRAHV